MVLKRTLTKLAELAIGNDQSSQGPQALNRLLAVLLGGLLVDRGTGGINGLRVEVLGLPDEILEQVAVVLGQE